MAQHANLDLSPFFLGGGPTGILLIHGYTGSPPEMRLVGEALNSAGLTVSGPCLPGHGTTAEEMNRCKWSDWTGCVEQSYGALRERCDKVFVAGLSMGSLLALYFAAHHPEIPGAIAYSPATWVQNRLLPLSPILRYFVKAVPKSSDSDLVDPRAEQRLWSYDVNPGPAAAQLYFLMVRVRRLLPKITCPLLIVYSTGDGAIHPTSAQRTFDLAGSRDKQIIKLEGSGHVITVDAHWQFVAEQTLGWVRQHGG
jgi:carboxylesterase